MNTDSILGRRLNTLDALFDLIFTPTFEPHWGKFRDRGLFNWPKVKQIESQSPCLFYAKAHGLTIMLPRLSSLTVHQP